MEPIEAVFLPETLESNPEHHPLPEEKPIQAEVTPSHLPPLRTTVKNPIYLHKNAKSLLQLREQSKNKYGGSQPFNKKLRDETFLKNYMEKQRKRIGSLNIAKVENQERRLIFKSTKVTKPSANIKPVEIRPQLKQMKQQYKLRELSIGRFLSDSDILQNYKMLSQLGRGSFSVVALAIDRESNRRYAVKTYAKIDEMEDYKFDNIYREINHLNQLSHQNIVNLFHVIKDKRKLLLIMEDGGKLSLAGLLRKTNTIPEYKVKNIFRQILEGINHCHQNKICHRDIKLENILVNGSDQVRLIDFGFSSKCGEKLKNFCGTPPYMAPEITTKLPYHGEPADMWALGILLYMMLYGKFPFRANSEKQLYRLIQQGKFDLGQGASPDAKQTIRKLLRCNIRQRATASQILGGKWLKEVS